jgi:autotransporter passenger strand-loop-strand repeat protein
VLSGGTLELLDGATQSGTTISSGGTLEIGSGQTLSGYRVSRGITLAATLGGRVSNTIVLSSGTFAVLSGGTANGITVSRGGAATIASGAVVSGAGKISAIGKGATLVVEGDIFTVGTGGVVLGSGVHMDLELGQVSGALIIARGATVNAVSGASTLLATSGKAIANSGLVNVWNGAILSLSGTVINSGTLFARGARSTIAIVGIVKGGTAEVGDGVVDITQASGEAVTYQSGGTGGLVLNDAIAYTGTLSGFGSGGNTGQFIDLTDVNIWSLHPLSYTPANAPNTSGTLTIIDGTHSAHIKFVGTYTSASFTAVNDGTGGVKISDPPVAQARVDLAQTGFGAHTTLGYSENSSDTGGILSIKNGTHIAKIALLGNYMATSFVAAADGHGGTLITDVSQTTQHTLLTNPHA